MDSLAVLDTCAYCKAETWCESRSNGKPQCRACKIERFFEYFLYAPLGFGLMPWQRKALRDLYGTVKDQGIRQYRRAFISVAKKNGKSFLIGGLPIYHLLLENEFRPQAYGCAAAKDQAGLVFAAATELIKRNPALSGKLRIMESTKRIVRRDGGGFYVVISADGDLQDGIEPSLALIDELHRWKTAKARTLYDVVIKGMISRREPLAVEITTAGEQFESPLWAQEHEFARQVLDGSLKSDTFYPAIWAADEKRIEKEPEYWKSREARVAANPSHEDHGGFLKDTAIVEELQKAIVNPAMRPAYLRYHLNIGITADEERAIDMARWMECGGEDDLRKWPDYDIDLLIRKWGLLDRPCWGGVDASWTTDLTSLVLVFPPKPKEQEWILLPFFWMPKERVAERERKDKVPYRAWTHCRWIEATEGNAVDQAGIRAKIEWAAEMFDLRALAYDPWNFRESANQLSEKGLTCIEIKPRYSLLSEPTKKLLELYLDRKIRHGNHPVLNWNASCLSLACDKQDNVMPSKPERNKSGKRIDGISATVTGMCPALRDDENRPSIYETRGLMALG